MNNYFKIKHPQNIGKITFIILIFIILILSITTFIEHQKGSSYTQQYVYGSGWFIALWIVLAMGACIYILNQRLRLSFSAILLHFSFIVILAGALVTHITSQSGMIHLQKNVQNNNFEQEDYGQKKLPFFMELTGFEIVNYPGTHAPADYISRFKIYDPKNEKIIQGEVSMNNIFQYRGYRFYQTSFDDDYQGSYLSINRDIAGIPLTYCGYSLLFISMFWLLIDKKGNFRKLLKNSVLKERDINHE